MSTTACLGTGQTGGVRSGARAMLPAAIGIAPFGVAIGAAIASADLDPVPALASSLLLFAGSAQLAMVQQLDARVAPVLVVLTVVVINARFVAYSAALAPLFPTTGVTTRAVMAATLVDQTYLVTTIEAAGGRRSERDLARFYLGASLAIGAVWLGSQAAGVLAGAALPAAANLGAAAPLSLAGLASRVTKDRSSGAAMAAGAVGMVVLAPVAGPAALLVAVALGVLASAATRRRPPSGEVAP